MHCKDCIRTCSSCGDGLCISTHHYNINCAQDNFNVCLHFSCNNKDSCTNVFICSENEYKTDVCDKCVKAGRASKLPHCWKCDKTCCGECIRTCSCCGNGFCFNYDENCSKENFENCDFSSRCFCNLCAGTVTVCQEVTAEYLVAAACDECMG